jgi:catechol 2,3-dioxygenase-like lactoylglutathione lyase family enzyme
MSSTQMRGESEINVSRAQRVEMKLEVVVIPVADVERSKRFYTDLGWRLDADFKVGEEFHAVQFTPVGSACSIHFGKGITSAAPGSAGGCILAVSDIEAARKELIDRGVTVGDVFHREGPGKPAIKGVHPQRNTYSSFASFSDPDGNTWLLQEVTSRLPGRLDTTDVTFSSSADLATALKRAETAHIEHEKRTGERDAQWSAWYAEYLVNERAGKPSPI